ncbi:restriction endonuclease subunit S [Segatella copri]|uniref:restriction endonuclease subunit S n=1 Tax=Segatella copri TaxID=165179 RepID=UPI0019333E0C|nr:restriction endonuclease subunit S [Segatella copri]
MWCKLEDIAYVGTGATPLTACKYYYENGNIAWINSSSTKVPFIAKASNFITQKAIEETNCLVYPKGTLVIAMYGEGKTRGQISELLIDAATNQACAAVRPYSEATKKYLKLFFEGNYLHIRALAEGGNQQNLSVGKIQNYEIPLPPLDEQKRILDKAKELLLQIDNIEVGKSVCQKYINQAKSKVLDLAIHGKLVSQDPNDEPAIELLKRINPKAEIITDNGHYQKLPDGWCLTILGSIGTWQSGATPSRLRKDYYGGNIPWLKTGDLNDGIITNIPEFITEKALEETSVKLNPTDSILIAMYGATIGKIGILSFPATTNQACCACLDYKIDKMYIFYFLLSNRINFVSMGGGGAQPNISKEKIVNTTFPLPPLAEQKRIVSKIEELFNQLDMIEESL